MLIFASLGQRQKTEPRRPDKQNASAPARCPGRVRTTMAEQEAWKQLYDYWLSKHVDGRPPTLREIDPPLDVPRLIAHILLIDVVDGFRYRLAGSAYWSRYGFELTGRWIVGKVPAEAEFRDTLQAVCDDGVARLLTAPVTDHPDRLHVGIVLPLSGADGGVSHILAGSFFAQDLADRPRIGRLTVQEILDETKAKQLGSMPVRLGRKR